MNKATTAQRKVALIFGGSRGIGAAAAIRLADDGFAVALTYVSRPDKAEEVVTSITKRGGQGFAIKADSADLRAINDAVAETIARFGPIDAVVVNAGVLHIATIDAFPLEALDQTLNVNIRGVFLAIQATVAQMRDGGRVIVIGSNVAIRSGSPGSSVYAMSKAAVATLVKGIALDLAPRRITANVIQPGPTETDMTAAMIPQLTKQVPLNRIGKPHEVATLVSYLAGKESGYMTGSSLTIDGGFVL